MYRYKGYLIKKWILPKELTIGSTVHSWTFFKEINSNEPRRLSAWPSLLTVTTWTFSLLLSQCISSPWTVFLMQTHSSKAMFSPFVNIFWLKHASLYTSHILHAFLCKFYTVYSSLPTKIWWQTSIQAWSTVWFAPILNSLKITVFMRLK